MVTVDKSVRDRLHKRLGQLKSAREDFRAHWREIQEVMDPWRGAFLSGDNTREATDGTKKHDKILDNTALYAGQVLASGLMSGLTPPSRPWFKLTLSDKQLLEAPGVRRYFAEIERRINEVFNKSNFYNSLDHVYGELGYFCTAAMYVTFDAEDVIHTRPLTCGEYFVATDSRRRVNTIYRQMSMTADQLVNEYGRENVSDQVKDRFDNNAKETRSKIIHAIEPMDEEWRSLTGIRAPFISVHYEEGCRDDIVLEIRGLDFFPALVPRWRVTGDRVYGSGPGFDTLADTKMLMEMQKQKLKALQKQVEPPVQAPGSMEGDIINSMPGGITYTRGDAGAGDRVVTSLYSVNVHFQELEFTLSSTRASIEKGFFNDLFLLLANNPGSSRMTAREVAERHEEKLLLLGPVLERLIHELLSPSIDMAFEALARRDMLPEPPSALDDGQDIDIEFVSILAQAQKLVGVTGVQQLAGFVGNLAGIKPEILDKINFDQMVDDFADIIGVPPDIVRADEDVQEIRQARVQQQLAQQAQEAAPAIKDVAQGAKLLSETTAQPNSMLNALIGGGDRRATAE